MSKLTPMLMSKKMLMRKRRDSGKGRERGKNLSIKVKKKGRESIYLTTTCHLQQGPNLATDTTKKIKTKTKTKKTTNSFYSRAKI